MRRVNDEIVALPGEGARETLRAAEPASAQCPREQRRVRGTAGEGQCDVEARIARQCAGKVRGLAAAAENEKLQHCHVADEVAL